MVVNDVQNRLGSKAECVLLVLLPVVGVLLLLPLPRHLGKVMMMTMVMMMVVMLLSSTLVSCSLFSSGKAATHSSTVTGERDLVLLKINSKVQNELRSKSRSKS